MLDKLRIIKQRFDEVSDLIIQPDIISDQKRYVKISKEYKDLNAVMKVGDEYRGLLKNIEEAKKWYKKAAEQGNEQAKKELESLEKSIPSK